MAAAGSVAPIASAWSPVRELPRFLQKPGALFLTLLLTYGIVHVTFLMLGVKFQWSTLGVYPHFLDIPVLRLALMQGLWYMHSQPPLYNLYLGTVLQTFPNAYSAVFEFVNVALGFLAFIGVYGFIRRMGAGFFWAYGIALYMLLTPGFIMHRSLLSYDLLVMLLGVVMAFAPFQAALLGLKPAGANTQRDRTIWLVVGIAAAYARCHVHTMFYWPYLILYAVFASYIALVPLRKMLLIALPFVVLLLAWNGKNLYLYGKFASGTWLGMSLGKVVIPMVRFSARNYYVKRGELSSIALHKPHSNLEEYPEIYRNYNPYPDIVWLRAQRKSAGARNLHHPAFIRISEAYLRDSLFLIRQFPDAYIDGLALAWTIYFESTSDLDFLDRMVLGEVLSYYLFWDTFVYGQMNFPVTNTVMESRPYLMIMLGSVLIIFFAVRLIVRTGRRQMNPLMDARARVAALLLVDVAFVAFISSAVECGENNRFRFLTAGNMLVLGGYVLSNRRLLFGKLPESAEPVEEMDAEESSEKLETKGAAT